MHFSRKNQMELLELAAHATESAAWMPDAIAIAALATPDSPPLAVAVYQNFRGTQADFHFANLTDRMERKLLKAYTAISFNPRLFGLETLWAQIADNNRAAQMAALRVGFTFEYRLRAGFPDGRDAIVLRMTAGNAVFASATHPEQPAQAA